MRSQIVYNNERLKQAKPMEDSGTETQLPSVDDYKNFPDETKRILEQNHTNFTDVTEQRMKSKPTSVSFYMNASTGRRQLNEVHGCINKLNLYQAARMAVCRSKGYTEAAAEKMTNLLPGDVCYISDLRVVSGYNDYNVPIKLNCTEETKQMGRYMMSELEGSESPDGKQTPALYMLHPQSNFHSDNGKQVHSMEHADHEKKFAKYATALTQVVCHYTDLHN